MKDQRLVKKRYISMSVVLLGFALVLFFLPKPYNNTEMKPESLLRELMDDTRYLSVDEVSDMIIKKDYILLVDVRTPKEYNEFRLPGAINIPLAELLDKDENGKLKWDNIFNQDVRKVIFYSNGTIYASQAWILTRRINVKNQYVMKGGLNEWFSTIIQPQRPPVEASSTEHELYNTRKAASMHFTGGGTPVSTESESPDAPVIINNTEQKEEEGGC